jgi:hypothetical protein
MTNKPETTPPKPNVAVLAQEFAYGTFQHSTEQLAALGFSVVGALDTVLSLYNVKLDHKLIRAVRDQADYIARLAELAIGDEEEVPI